MTAEQRLALLTGTDIASGGSSGGSSAGPAGTGFVATNPTPGTAIVHAINASYSATAGAFLAFQNLSNGGKLTFLDYIKLQIAVVPPNGVNLQYAFYLDTPESLRYTSGGSRITPANPNGNDATAPQTSLYAGALTTAAASLNARLVARGAFLGFIPKIYDEYVIDFGGPVSPGWSKASNAASGRHVVNAPAVAIPPRWYGLLHLWSTTSDTTAPQYEFETSWVEANQ
jgi:hypothetical protein